MQTLTRYLTLVLAICLTTSSVALADKDDKDKDKKRSSNTAQFGKTGVLPDPGDCSIGLAQKDLDVNNVRARLFNFGSMAYGNGAEAQYVVPKASGHSPIYASGVWIGGTVGGELRTAGATYTNFEFWPGPLGPDGRPVNPSNCAQFDRLYKVSRSDIQTYEATGQAAPDLADWPVDLGAPVIDGDGVEGNYNLSGGDRPDLIGDQAVWWIMNDVGNAHNNTQAPPIGVEVRVHAFAFNRADALGNTTFFKYNITYKGDATLENTFLSIFSDPDLGAAGDDYVGVDTSLSLGYVYNANPVDAVYGAAPAAGYDFFQGPISASGDTLGVTSFMYFINGGPEGTEDPHLSQEIYNVQQGRWRGGQPLTARGLGFQTNGPVTKFAYPGDPVTAEYWSEVNNDGSASANQPGDRRLVMSTGPFSLEPGDSQDIVFGVVFAQGSDNLSSISALRAADILAQAAYNANFNIPNPPPAPPRCDANSSNPALQPGSGNCLYASEMDGQAALVWGYPSNSENFLGSYDLIDPFITGLGFEDTTYTFEGFNIYRYPTASFSPDQRELVATFDIVNGVTKVTDPVFDADVGEFVPAVSARGTDSGLQYFYVVPNLTNYTDYYYGISAYAYSPNSTPRILESAPSNITLRPSRIASREGGSATPADITQSDSLATAVSQAGQGTVAYRIVDPAELSGATYQVEFVSLEGLEGPGGESGAGKVGYNIVRQSDGKVVVDAASYFESTGLTTPQGRNVLTFDGLSVSIEGPEAGFDQFRVVRNADGPVSPPAWAGPDFQGFPGPPETPVPSQVGMPTQQVGSEVYGWFVHTWPSGSFASYNDFLGRTLQYTGGFGADVNGITHIAPDDVEIRFTGNGKAWIKPGWSGGNTAGMVVDVPFEWWNTGPTDDPSDDYQLVPWLYDYDGNAEWTILWDSIYPDDPEGWADHPMSGAQNDPWTEPVYIMAPTNDTPGSQGYEQAMDKLAELGAGAIDAGCPDWYYQPGQASIPECDLWNYMSRTVFTFWNGGDVTTATGPDDYTMAAPEIGTVFQITTTKPHQPGDTFAISTEGLGRVAGDQEILEESLDDIGIVPNPYRGRSSYEVGNQDRRVRFTNLPAQATIRVYTVSGTLIRTLHKDGPSTSLDWNLATDANLPVASGMYFIHVDVPGVGERVLKFGVVNRETNINIF